MTLVEVILKNLLRSCSSEKYDARSLKNVRKTLATQKPYGFWFYWFLRDFKANRKKNRLLQNHTSGLFLRIPDISKAVGSFSNVIKINEISLVCLYLSCYCGDSESGYFSSSIFLVSFLHYLFPNVMEEQTILHSISIFSRFLTIYS